VETGHHRAFTPPLPEPGADVDEDEEEYELENEASAIEDFTPAPACAEPRTTGISQRPGGQQRHVRRLDRGALMVHEAIATDLLGMPSTFRHSCENAKRG